MLESQWSIDTTHNNMTGGEKEIKATKNEQDGDMLTMIKKCMFESLRI